MAEITLCQYDVPIGGLDRVEIGGEVVNLTALDDAAKVELILRVRAGEVLSIRFSARVFGDRPNLNLVRPRPGQMAAIAASFAGAVWTPDHNTYSTNARRGTVARGTVVVADDGVDELVLTLEARDPDAQERVIRGLIDRFSIGLRGVNHACSICGAHASYGWWSMETECEHVVGKVYDGTLCEIWFDEPSGHHVSDVLIPAYEDTQILASLYAADPATARRVMPAHLHYAAPAATPREDAMPGQPTTGAPAPTHATDTSDTAAELAAVRAQLAAEREARAAAELAAFSLEFDRAVEQRRVMPAEREDLLEFAQTFGLERLRRHLAHRAPVSGYESSPVGGLAADPAIASSRAEDPLALARHLRGTLPREYMSEEKLAEIGFGELTFS